MSDLALSIVLGVALAAATGFRVFLPMLIASGAAYTGHLHLGDGFAWLGSPSALIMLSVAALVEVLAYTIPVIDNLLDVVSAPAAFIAGTILSAAVSRSSVLTPSSAISPNFCSTFHTSSPLRRIFSSSDRDLRTIMG